MGIAVSDASLAAAPAGGADPSAESVGLERGRGNWPENSVRPALVLPEAVIREGVALDPRRDFTDQAASVQSAFAELADLLA